MEIGEIKLKLEELEIEPELHGSILEKINSNHPKIMHEMIDSKSQVFELKNELDKEEDWRKKAAIAAKIISLGLE